MAETWIVAAFAAGLAVAGILYQFLRRPAVTEPAFSDPREERLARRLAKTVGCSPAQAAPAVRTEIEYSPNQPDDTLFKRALYHYRQNQPEKTCGVYRDQTRG